MSFSGTPLGQGRRLDHSTFLNKTSSLTNNHNTRPLLPPTSPQRAVPTSYAYGAPTAGTRSPTKPLSASSSHSAPDQGAVDHADEPALVRYARLKQEQSLNSRSSSNIGPPGIPLNLEPEKWSVKDTSVNIATAFSQAASTSYEMQSNNPNNSWASGSQTNLNVPRSTSVEYEKETHSTTSRRLAPPPNRLTQRPIRKPISKEASGVTHVSDSEGEDHLEQPVPSNSRGKSPFDHVVDLSRRAIGSATFYLRQRSQEPAERSFASNGRESSYDYASEERTFQELQGADISREETSIRRTAPHKRNKISLDNKAYHPSVSDEEDSDDNISDEGRKRKKKLKKKDLGGGLLTTLPVAGYDKRRKRKSKGGKGNVDEGAEGIDEDGESSSGSEQRSGPQRATLSRGSVGRGSVPPILGPSVSRSSVPLKPMYHYDTSGENDSMDLEGGLTSIPEVDEIPPLVDGMTPRPAPFTRPFSVGGFLGVIVYGILNIIKGIFRSLINMLSALALLLGQILGTAFDIVFRRPAKWISRTMNSPSLFLLIHYLLITAALYSAWYTLRSPLSQWIPGQTTKPYIPSDVPISNLDELSARLQSIESALSGLSLDQQRARSQQDLDSRNRGELLNRIYALEAKLREETRRSFEIEQSAKVSADQSMKDLRKEMEVIQSQIHSIDASPRDDTQPMTNDEEARTKLKALEDRLGNVEGEVKEALELGRNSAKAGGVAMSAGSAWWNKLASGVGTGTGLTIKSSDGQDVTPLIEHIVDSVVARYATRDIISRPDFALHSAGARVLPSMTSGTLEIRPQTWRGQILGLVTGNGYEVGRSPITALHQELHSGNCWPMTGTYGQLGVALAFPAYLTDFTVDHVAKEVAFDLRSAPRDMEVWGLVEGQENIAKWREWKTEKSTKAEERRRKAEEGGTELTEDKEEFPSTLPKNEPYVRLASFTYDIHAPQNIQTFPVLQEIQDLGIDFGIINLVIKNNWGRDEFTCLYRFRAHGEALGGLPHTYVPNESS